MHAGFELTAPLHSTPSLSFLFKKYLFNQQINVSGIHCPAKRKFYLLNDLDSSPILLLEPNKRMGSIVGGEFFFPQLQYQEFVAVIQFNILILRNRIFNDNANFPLYEILRFFSLSILI